LTADAVAPAEGELAGRTSLVTGGSRGIGLAISRALADAGSRVAVVGRDEARAGEAARALPGTGHRGYGCDVADAGAVQALVARVQEELGDVSVLVNNAGVTRDNILMRMKDEEWDEVIAVNLKGAFNLSRALSRGMMKRRDGVIVNVTSIVGLTGNPGQANYSASKAGLIGLTKSVARELASRNVRCNAVAPGFIQTDMTAALGEKAVEALVGRIPLGTLGNPEDVAAVVRFLAGPGARYITGQVIAVDGGMVM
jgi:3-oxoacyl-[acyl-carrier protein] reductase